MRKVFMFLVMFLWPMSLLAMTLLSDSTLSDVTGQAGVNINADIAMDISMSTLAWGDSDGIGVLSSYGWDTNTTGGYVGVNDFNITNFRIKARETDTYGGYTPSLYKPITIDVASTPDLYDGATFVRFGLGSTEVSVDALNMDVALGQRAAAPILNQTLGRVSVGELRFYLRGASYVDIYTLPGVCVNATWAVYVDGFRIGVISWGDLDGLPGGNMGSGGTHWMDDGYRGYVGLRNMNFGGQIAITGTTRLDVTTSALETGIYSANGQVSVVHIGFSDNFTIAADGPITAEVKLDSQADLNSINAGTLGDIYVDNFSLSIADSSWVDVWAH